VTSPSLIGHNDIAPYNVCFDDDELVRVFDWDLAGPSTPLLELAFIAWNCVPLWRDTGPAAVAARLAVIAATYGPVAAGEILHAVPYRIQTMLDGIPAAAAAGDEGMARLMAGEEPGRSASSLAGLIDRIPAIDPAAGLNRARDRPETLAVERWTSCALELLGSGEGGRSDRWARAGSRDCGRRRRGR
jgi:Phosphotransferase enzyme family